MITTESSSSSINSSELLQNLPNNDSNTNENLILSEETVLCDVIELHCHQFFIPQQLPNQNLQDTLEDLLNKIQHFDSNGSFSCRVYLVLCMTSICLLPPFLNSADKNLANSTVEEFQTLLDYLCKVRTMLLRKDATTFMPPTFLDIPPTTTTSFTKNKTINEEVAKQKEFQEDFHSIVTKFHTQQALSYIRKHIPLLVNEHTADNNSNDDNNNDAPSPEILKKYMQFIQSDRFHDVEHTRTILLDIIGIDDDDDTIFLQSKTIVQKTIKENLHLLSLKELQKNVRQLLLDWYRIVLPKPKLVQLDYSTNSNRYFTTLLQRPITNSTTIPPNINTMTDESSNTNKNTTIFIETENMGIDDNFNSEIALNDKNDSLKENAEEFEDSGEADSVRNKNKLSDSLSNYFLPGKIVRSRQKTMFYNPVQIQQEKSPLKRRTHVKKVSELTVLDTTQKEKNDNRRRDSVEFTTTILPPIAITTNSIGKASRVIKKLGNARRNLSRVTVDPLKECYDIAKQATEQVSLSRENNNNHPTSVATAAKQNKQKSFPEKILANDPSKGYHCESSFLKKKIKKTVVSEDDINEEKNCITISSTRKRKTISDQEVDTNKETSLSSINSASWNQKRNRKKTNIYSPTQESREGETIDPEKENDPDYHVNTKRKKIMKKKTTVSDDGVIRKKYTTIQKKRNIEEHEDETSTISNNKKRKRKKPDFYSPPQEEEDSEKVDRPIDNKRMTALSYYSPKKKKLNDKQMKCRKENELGGDTNDDDASASFLSIMGSELYTQEVIELDLNDDDTATIKGSNTTDKRKKTILPPTNEGATRDIEKYASHTRKMYSKKKSAIVIRFDSDDDSHDDENDEPYCIMKLRQRRFFTQEEKETILQAVEKWGKQWSVIRSENIDILGSRTATSIKVCQGLLS